VLGDDARSERFLALTGLTPEVLRNGLGDSATLGAILDYLAAHEADLTAAADALGVTPQALAQAGTALR